MNIRLLTGTNDLQRYDRWIKAHPHGTLWQSLERRQYLEALGQEVRIFVIDDGEHFRASALVTIDTTFGGFSTWEIPRGPIGKDLELLMRFVTAEAMKSRCMTMFLSSPEYLRYRPSKRFVHCEATIVIDLDQPEDTILAQMKPKGRYNIKVAEKHGVVVRASRDIDAFYSLVSDTSSRDGFTPLPKDHYHRFLEHLPGSLLLLAYSPEQEPIAGLLNVLWNKQAIYYYGASSHAHRASMAPYLLQWEAIKFAKKAKCRTYDLLGIAPSSDADGSHPWRGITAFKEKFGGRVVNYPPEQQIVLRPLVQWAFATKRRMFG